MSNLAPIADNRVECVIPFSGFYESWHDAALDDALSSAFQDDSGTMIHGDLYNRAFAAVRWRAAHLEYAQEYVSSWEDVAELKTIEFRELLSPREYNFGTDQIVATIDKAELRRVFDNVDRKALERLARERLSPRSGFIPHYPVAVREWGAVEDWPAALIGILLEAHWETVTGDDWETCDWESYIGGELNSAGCVEPMLTSDDADPTGDVARFMNIAYALCQRAERDTARAGPDLYAKSAAAFDADRF